MKYLFALFFYVAAHAALAEDLIHLDKRVSNADFHRAIACAAPPGGTCTLPLVRWPEARQPDVRVALVRSDETFPTREVALSDQAIDSAIAQINSAGSNVTMRRVASTEDAEIKIYLLDVPQNSTLQNTGIPDMDGIRIAAAHVHVWWDGERNLRRSVIIMTPGQSVRDYRSIFLEEMYQSLGLLIDVTGPLYQLSTIVHQDSNMRTTLGAQDKAALRLHYPAP